METWVVPRLVILVIIGISVTVFVSIHFIRRRMSGITVSSLFQPESEMDLATSDWSFYPGESIDVQATFLPLEKFYVREGRIELVCTEVFYAEVPGHRGGTRVALVSEDKVYATQSFLSETDVVEGIPYRAHATLSIPEDARPSVEGDIAHMCWHCRLVIDTVLSGDIFQSQGIIILAPPIPASPVVRKADYGGASLCLSLPSAQFREGETLSATLRIRLKPGVKYKGMRLQLERKEQSGVKQFAKVEDRAVLITPSTSPVDGTLDWNVQLQVPQDQLLPTTAPGVTSVSWSIKGMLIRSGIVYALRILRPDHMQVEQVIQVYTG